MDGAPHGASRCTAVQRVAPQAHSWCDAGTEKYVDRGIIPRTISMLFNEFSKRTDHTFQVRNLISPTGPGATVAHCVGVCAAAPRIYSCRYIHGVAGAFLLHGDIQ